MNDYYNKILDIYSLTNSKESSISINRFLIEISCNYLKSISKNEYINCLILIQTLFSTENPDHSYHRGKTRNLLETHEYKAFKKIIQQEFV